MTVDGRGLRTECLSSTTLQLWSTWGGDRESQSDLPREAIRMRLDAGSGVLVLGVDEGLESLPILLCSGVLRRLEGVVGLAGTRTIPSLLED